MSGWAFLSIALQAEAPIQDGGLVDPLYVAHDGICFGPSALDHDLRQAGAMMQQVLCATNTHGVSADSFDDRLTQPGFPGQLFCKSARFGFRTGSR